MKEWNLLVNLSSNLNYIARTEHILELYKKASSLNINL